MQSRHTSVTAQVSFALADAPTQLYEMARLARANRTAARRKPLEGALDGREGLRQNTQPIRRSVSWLDWNM
jgi:hypothetical protein